MSDVINATITSRIFGSKVTITVPLDHACDVSDGIIANRASNNSDNSDTVRQECAAIAAACRKGALDAASAAAVNAGKAKREVRSAHLKFMMRALKAAGK